MLARRIAARQPPPTCLPELRRALLDECCNIPQDEIDNLILSMPRCCFSSDLDLLRLRAKTAWSFRELLDPTSGQPDCTLSAAVLPWRPKENLKHTKKDGTDKDYTTNT
ncbi:transposable element Tc3 transposase [Trichonephila clavipes]|nr:transposable element Tc3 transposase [Trichonephila clavipes]